MAPRLVSIIGAEDAPYLAREFQPVFGVPDLLNLPNHSIYLKLMIDGVPSRPFSGENLFYEKDGDLPPENISV